MMRTCLRRGLVRNQLQQGVDEFVPPQIQKQYSEIRRKKNRRKKMNIMPKNKNKMNGENPK